MVLFNFTIVEIARQTKNKNFTCLFFLAICIEIPPPADLPNNVKLVILYLLIILFAVFANVIRNFSFILYFSSLLVIF